MSADFLLARLPSCELTDVRVQQLLSGITEDDVKEIEDCGRWPDTADDNDAELTVELLRQKVDHLLKEVAKAQGSCEMSTEMWDGRPCLVSGGMSWGDDPTEASNWLWFLGNIASVYNKLNAWALEDAVADKARRKQVQALAGELNAALAAH